jgi:hypothetical protein
MNLRPLIISVSVLVALSAVVWYLRRPAPPASADPRVGQNIVAADVVSQAAEVRISDQGKTVTVKREAENRWVVPEYHSFPADFTKLSRLTTDLADAKLQRVVTSRPERIERLEFKGGSIALLDASGKSLWSVSLGRTAEAGGRYVKFGDEQKAYLANLNAWIDVEPKSWVDTTLLSLKPEEVARVEIGFVEKGVPPVVVSRAKKEDAFAAEKAPDGRKLKVETVNSLLSSVGALRFSETTPTDDPQVQAAREHARAIKLTTFDGTAYTVVLGRKPEEKKPKEKPVAAAEPAAPEKAAAPEAPKEATADQPKPAEPEFETVPAGPVFAFITSSAKDARINEMMSKRAFQVSEWTVNGLPAKTDDLFEPAPEPKAEEPKS